MAFCLPQNSPHALPPQYAPDCSGPMKGWWSSLRGSLGGLRRLSQPCFLPLEAGAGPFALLLAALAIGSALMPDWPVRFLPGVAPRGHGPLARVERLDPAGFAGGWAPRRLLT
jgi:hypothetical protein